MLRDNHYEITPLLEKIFLSRDFYSPASVGTQIKSPVQLAVSTYKKLGQKNIPGVPDFNLATSALGQQLFSPPTVAGWAGGQSWITPGLLLERGNFARDILFPDISFLPPDRYTGGGEVRRVAERIRQGMDITTATMDDTKSGDRAESNKNADRDEDFNTRYGSFRGSQMAIERVKPIPRDTAQINLSQMVLDAAPEEHHAGGRLSDSSLHARSAQRRGAPETDRVPEQRLGHHRYRRRPDLYGGLAAAGPAPDHEPARVSVGLRSASP